MPTMERIIKVVLGGETKEGDRIAAQPLKFSSISAFGSGLLGLAAVIVPVVKYVVGQHLTSAQITAAVILLAASIVAFALASAGDALARAYSAAWVVPKTSAKAGKDGHPAHPALVDVAMALTPPRRPRVDGGGTRAALAIERALNVLSEADEELLAPLTAHQRLEFRQLVAKLDGDDVQSEKAE